MNESSNISEITEYTLDDWYNYFGVPFEMDITYVYVLTPISLLSSGFNLLTFIVLLNKDFNLSVIYSYLRLYIFNSLIISFILTTTFVSNSYRIYSFTNTFGSITYGIYVFTPILTVLYFYSNLLEICIIIERTEKYLPAKYRYLKNLDFNKLCLGLFAFSIILNIPAFLNYYTAVENVQLEKNTTHLIYYWGISEFSASYYGKAITFTVFFIRDFLFLTIKIGLNILSVHAIRKYLGKLNVVGDVQLTAKKTYISQTDKNLTKMVIIAIVFSIFENIFFAIANGYYIIVIDQISCYLILVSYLAVAFKHGLNFFIFFMYNNSFRNVFNREILHFFKVK